MDLQYQIKSNILIRGDTNKNSWCFISDNSFIPVAHTVALKDDHMLVFFNYTAKSKAFSWEMIPVIGSPFLFLVMYVHRNVHRYFGGSSQKKGPIAKIINK